MTTKLPGGILHEGRNQVIQFFVDDAVAAKLDGPVTLEWAAAHNYALRQRWAAEGRPPDDVTKTRDADGKRTGYRLTWMPVDVSAAAPGDPSKMSDEASQAPAQTQEVTE